MIPNESKIVDEGKHFALLLAIVVGILSLLPQIIGTVSSTASNVFVGYPYATDDHMVYAAWMRQAQDFHFFFDNRFAVDAQPGLTIHLYFFVLGLISKIVGIPWTTAIAKALFSGLFVVLAQRLIRKFTSELYTIKMSLALTVFGGGIGILVWHKFGEAFTKPMNSKLTAQMLSRLPTDNWQPEGFVFPSMMTNSLFMVSLCLIVYIITAIIEAKDSWKPVIPAAACVLVLTNIHSYDVLLLLLVSIGFIAVSVYQRRMSKDWLVRGAAIFAGGIPSALWIYYVLKSDPVFQARAATLTYAPNFRQVFFGYLCLLVLAVIGFLATGIGTEQINKAKRLIGGFGVIAIISALYFMAPGNLEGYFLTPMLFASFMIAMIICACLLAGENDMLNFVLSWALVGLVAMYFPALFQRKLAMGLSIPWAILGAYAVSNLFKANSLSIRQLAAAVAVGASSLTTLMWLQRELMFVRDEISRTTTLPLFLSKPLADMVTALNDRGNEKKVVIAIPGAPTQKFDGLDPKDLDEYLAPQIADMNAIISGYTGAYSYAGHWSETPKYLERRKKSLKFFLRKSTDQFRQDIYNECDPNATIYAIGPAQNTFGLYGNSGFVDLTTMGEVIVSGKDYVLVKIR